MKIKIIILIMLSATLLVYAVAVLLWGYPIIIDFSKKITVENIELNKGDTIYPFKKFNFNNGKWKAYLLLKSDKINLNKAMLNGNCFMTEDTKILKRIQNEWKFIYSGGDVATVESSILLYHNENKVFESGIVLDENLQGLQNSQYGWLEGSNLIENCKQFKKINYPIIFLK